MVTGAGQGAHRQGRVTASLSWPGLGVPRVATARQPCEAVTGAAMAQESLQREGAQVPWWAQAGRLLPGKGGFHQLAWGRPREVPVSQAGVCSCELLDEGPSPAGPWGPPWTPAGPVQPPSPVTRAFHHVCRQPPRRWRGCVPPGALTSPAPPRPAQIARLRSELAVVRGNTKVLSEMLTEMVPGQEAASDLELLQVRACPQGPSQAAQCQRPEEEEA